MKRRAFFVKLRALRGKNFMRLRIKHQTTFTYEEWIAEAFTELRLKPLDTGGQMCLSFGLTTEPRSEVLQYADRFGNDVRYFDVLYPHQKLSVVSVGEVITPAEYRDVAQTLSSLDEFDFTAPTHYAPITDELVAFAHQRKTNDGAFATAMNLMRAIYDDFKYEPGATDVKTTADQLLELRRGVCQDFAHLMLSLCRSQNIPARYVSGYLYSPRVSANGDNAASHAWVDVYADHGWVSLDPTHNQTQTEQYVRVAVGRDYADVPPTRGTFRGNAKEKLDVIVTVNIV